MKALVNVEKGRLALMDVPLPEPGVDQVRIRTAVCGICATDLEMIDGSARSKYPQILGHEWSGIVDKCGASVDVSLMGRSCVAENVLAVGGEVGFEHSGGYGECLVTDAANVQVLPPGFPMAEAALIEPLAVAVRGIERLQPAEGPALILGDGPLGLLFVMLFKHQGIKNITVCGGRETRLELALELGADRAINYHTVQTSLGEAIVSMGVDQVASIVDATTSASSIPLMSDVGTTESKILLIGNYENRTATVPLQEFLWREWSLIASNASAGAWPDAVSLTVGQHLPLRKLISRCFPAAGFEAAMNMARNDRGIVKVFLDWEIAG